MRSKKGVTVVLAALAIGIAVLVVVVFFTLAIAHSISPTLSSLACGANTRIKAASPIIELVPLFMCKQYDTPVKIDGTDFTKCSAIDRTICNRDTQGLLRDACEQQCIRIQVDELADLCWSVGGNGRYDFLGGIAKSQSDNAVLRCFRYQVVEPTIDSDGNELANIFDSSHGNSSKEYALAGPYYSQDPSYADIVKTCTARFRTNEDPTCEMGGGVKAVQFISRGREEYLDWFTQRVRQVCFMSYVQDGGERYLWRSCSLWNPPFEDGKGFFFLN